LLVVVGVLLTVAGLASAATRRPNAKTRPIVIHARWRVVASRATDFNVDQRYFFLVGGSPSGGGTLIDDQTGSRTQITPPEPVCYVVGASVDPWTFDGFGGRWLMFRCRGSSDSETVELYSVTGGTWRTVDYSQRQDAECGPTPSSLSFCSISPVAVGAHWLEFAISGVSGDSRNALVGYGFENLDTGAWRQTETRAPSQPPDRFTLAGLSAAKMLDLDSPSLSVAVCRPLRLPHAGTLDATITNEGPGQIVSPVLLYGRLAVLGDPESMLNNLHLQRCGSRKRYQLGRLTKTPNAGLSAVSSQALIWTWKVGQENGIFLASLQRFAIRPLPRDISPGGGDEFRLSARHLYAHAASDGWVWEAPLPRLPMKPRQR